VHRWHRKLADDLGSATMPNVRMQDVCVFFVRASARALEIEQQGQGARASPRTTATAPRRCATAAARR
jgi:hypothetical protein